MSVTLRAVVRRVAAVLAAVALLGVSALATAQPRVALSPAAALVYQRWLASTCVEGEEAARAAELRRHASELAPAFERAIAAGPPPEEIARVRVAAARATPSGRSSTWAPSGSPGSTPPTSSGSRA